MDKPTQPQAVETDCIDSPAYSADPAINQAREERPTRKLLHHLGLSKNRLYQDALLTSFKQ